ncbi:MAG: hypothetical protein QM783_16250 [Phycisphaerales bacterium]
MSQMPNEPDAFAEQVVVMLRKIQPDYTIELTGPRELLVNGRRLDLENLYRLVNHDPVRGTEIVEHYLDQLFSGEANIVGGMSFELIRGRIMPRVQPETIFNHLARAGGARSVRQRHGHRVRDRHAEHDCQRDERADDPLGRDGRRS